MQINVKKIHTYTGHRDCIYALSRGTDDNIFYSAGGEGYVVKWDLAGQADGQVVARVDASVYAIHYHALQNLLIIGQNNDGIHLVDPDKKKVVGSLKLTTSAIFDISSSGKEGYIATGDGFLIVVDLENLSVLGKVKLSEKSLRSIDVGNGTGLLALGASDNNIYLFDVNNQTLIQKLEGHKNSVFSVKYSDSANNLISASRDAHLNFWKIENNFSLETSIPAHMYAINHIEFHKDRKCFATGSMDKTIKLWDFEKRKLLKVIDKARYEGHISSVNKLYWSNYNNYLVSAGDDRIICVWDLEFNY